MREIVAYIFKMSIMYMCVCEYLVPFSLSDWTDDLRACILSSCFTCTNQTRKANQPLSLLFSPHPLLSAVPRLFNLLEIEKTSPIKQPHKTVCPSILTLDSNLSPVARHQQMKKKPKSNRHHLLPQIQRPYVRYIVRIIWHNKPHETYSNACPHLVLQLATIAKKENWRNICLIR